MERDDLIHDHKYSVAANHDENHGGIAITVSEQPAHNPRMSLSQLTYNINNCVMLEPRQHYKTPS